MLVLPTSATTAILLEQPLKSPLWTLFGYVTVVLLAGGIYCAWEMLLASASGRRPARSRWVMLLVSVALFGAGILVDAFVNVPVTFNDQMETYWGFVLSPWFFVAFIPCAAILLFLRLADARKTGSFARIPGIVWWIGGLLVASAYGAGALWAGGRSPVIGFYVSAAGTGLAIAAVGALLVVAISCRGGRRMAL